MARGALLTAALGAATALCVSACASSSLPPGADVRASAREATERGAWAEAAEYWHRCIELDGVQSSTPFVETARAFGQLDQTEEGIAILGQGLRYHPEDPELYEARGLLLERAGYARAAEDDLQLAVEADAERASAWLALGRVRLELDQPRAALAPLRTAMEKGADTCQTLELLARASRRCGEHAQAWELYRAALAAGEPGQIELLVEIASLATSEESRAECCAELGSEWLEQAEALLDRALALDPQHAPAWFVKAVMAEERGDNGAAIAAYRRAIEVDNLHLDSITNLALLYCRLGEREAAFEMIDRALALERDPERSEALSQLANDPDMALDSPQRPR